MINLYRQAGRNKQTCLICPNYCTLAEGETGKCGVRTNKENKIVLDTYGIISAMAVEPIEKKPITHVLQGTKTLSIGSYGCSLKCKFCENHLISQDQINITKKRYTCREIVLIAKQYDCASICMTYNEPTISFEFLYDLAMEAKLSGLKFVIKTNGYVNREVWQGVCSIADIMNIDWKGNYQSYIKMAGGFPSIVFNRIKEAVADGVHVEISIPLHDQMEPEHLSEFGEMLYEECVTNIPCHLLKIQAAYNHPGTTSVEHLQKCKEALSKRIEIITVH